MDQSLKFQIPNATPAPVAAGLRKFEREVARIADDLNNPAERMAFYSAGYAWLGENQKVIVISGVQRVETDRDHKEALEFQIPSETPARVATALRTFEREVLEIVGTLNGPAERLALYGATQVWVAEAQRAMVLPASKTHGAGAGAPGPHAA